jgi:hypothetical protein
MFSKVEFLHSQRLQNAATNKVHADKNKDLALLELKVLHP